MLSFKIGLVNNHMLTPREKFFTGLRDLVKGIEDLGATLEQETYAGWVVSNRGEFATPTAATREAWATYARLHYNDNSDGRLTDRAIGALVVGREASVAAQQVNKLKAEFEEAVDALKSEEGIDEFDNWMQKTKEMRELLISLGRRRIHLLQCYRKIPIVEDRPDSMSFTWVQHAQVLRPVTRDHLVDRLSRLRDKPKVDVLGLEQDRDTLMRLAADTQLRVARASPACPRLNLVYVEDGKIVQEKRRCIYATLPVLIVGAVGDTMPRLRKIGLKPPELPDRRMSPANSWASRGSILRTMTVYAA